MAQWSVYTRKHGSGAPREGIQGASFAADHGNVGEIAKGLTGGRKTEGGAVWTDPRDKSQHTKIHITTPEGHAVPEHLVDGLIGGSVDPSHARTEAFHASEKAKQSEFETRVRTHMATHGKLPESGTDAAAAGVPTASSEAGRHITAGYSTKGKGGSAFAMNYTHPHYSGDVSKEHPGVAHSKYQSSVADRGNHPGRSVGHSVETGFNHMR